MTIKIVTDSNCDLPQEIIEEYGITVMPLYINIGSKSYLDGVELSHEAFYEGLDSFESHPFTSVPGPGRIIETFEKLLGDGATEILAIHVAGNLSAMVNTVKITVDQWTKIPVQVFDSGNLTLGTGLQVLAAAKAAAAGQTMQEIIHAVTDVAKRTYCFAALDTVKYLQRSGRLTKFQAGLASALQIKPLLKMNDGEFEMEKIRTSKSALKRLMDLLNDLGPLEQLTLVHTHALERASEIWTKISDSFPTDILKMTAEVTPVIGTHIGPGAVGFVVVKAAE